MSAVKHLTCLLDYEPCITNKLYPGTEYLDPVNGITRVDYVNQHTKQLKKKKGIKIVQQIHNVVCQLHLNKAGGKYLGIKFFIRSLNQDIYWFIHTYI